MKRRASEDAGCENPAKVSKDAGNNQASALARADTVVKKSADAEPTRGRQRKAPAWLSSYVTGGSAKDLAKAASEVPIPTKKSPSTVAKKKGSGEDVKKVEEKTPKKAVEKSISKNKTVQKMPMETVNNKIVSSKSLSSSSISTLPLSSSSTSSSRSSSKHSSAMHSKLSSASGLANIESILEVCEDRDIATASSSVNLKNSKSASSVSSSFGKKIDMSAGGGGDTLKNGGTKIGKITALESPVPLAKEETILVPKKGETPTMLEVVICVSTSGAMQEYLAELQEQAREMVWRLQSLIPDLRIGVFAHTQGGIHDDKRPGGSCSVANIDHNYIRTGGHSGTKWLDLGASFSQICAFVNSLEPEATVYPDYVQDNLEMALWKLQRCMTWSSCSYRTVVMLGRGRPNSTTFYLQREHWRGWIRSALELGPRQEVPVIDWQLEARLLAQMGIHVFTLQVGSERSASQEEEEEDDEDGTVFFRETAAITNGQHFRLTDASRLVDIVIGVCCACYGPDLLQEHRDELRDQNDGVVPAKLKEIFVSLGLHSNRRSLKTIPSLVGDLQAMQSKIKAADLANGRLLSISEEEGGMSSEGEDWGTKTNIKVKKEASEDVKVNKKAVKKSKTESPQDKPLSVGKAAVKKEKVKVKNEAVKSGRVEKKSAKAVEDKKVANVLKKLKPDKAANIKLKTASAKVEKRNGVLKSGSLNGKNKPAVAQVKKVGRPRLTTTKAAALVKKAATPAKRITNSPKVKPDSKEMKKSSTENKPENSMREKPTPVVTEVEVKKRRGRPPKEKEALHPPSKPQAKNEKKERAAHNNAALKKNHASGNKSAAIANNVDKKNAASQGKVEKKSVASTNMKMTNGKTPVKSIESVKKRGRPPSGKNNKLVKENLSAGKKLSQGGRRKGAVTVTRGSLRVRK